MCMREREQWGLLRDRDLRQSIVCTIQGPKQQFSVGSEDPVVRIARVVCVTGGGTA